LFFDPLREKKEGMKENKGYRRKRKKKQEKDDEHGDKNV